MYSSKDCTSPGLRCYTTLWKLII